MLYDKIIQKKKKVLICSENLLTCSYSQGPLQHPKHPHFPRPWVTLFFIGRHEKKHKG